MSLSSDITQQIKEVHVLGDSNPTLGPHALNQGETLGAIYQRFLDLNHGHALDLSTALCHTDSVLKGLITKYNICSPRNYW